MSSIRRDQRVKNLCRTTDFLKCDLTEELWHLDSTGWFLEGEAHLGGRQHAGTQREKADDPVKDGGGEEEEVRTKHQQGRQKKEARWQQANNEGGIVLKTPADLTADHPKTAPA